MHLTGLSLPLSGKLVATGGNLTRRPQKVILLSPGRENMANKCAKCQTEVD